MTRPGALVAGALLFALPLLQSGLGQTHRDGNTPHMDHTPRHGGVLLMIGQVHLEIVERARTIDVYPSDSMRRPLRPASGSVRFDDHAARALEWSGYRLTAPMPPRYGAAEYNIAFHDGPPLSIRLSRADLSRLAD